MIKLKRAPKFKNEAEEAKFWLRADSTKYVDYSKVEKWIFPNLKLSSRPITMRLPSGLIDRYKLKANKMDVSYQALMKQVLFNGLEGA